LFTIGLSSATLRAVSAVVPEEQALTRKAEAVRATAVAVRLMCFTGDPSQAKWEDALLFFSAEIRLVRLQSP
jgi:hypothetical protein